MVCALPHSYLLVSSRQVQETYKQIGTFQRKPFGSVLELIPVAELVTKLTAVCMVCFKDASFRYFHPFLSDYYNFLMHIIVAELVQRHK